MAFKQTETCLSIIIEIDDMVVEKMRRLRLGHLISMLSVEFPHSPTLGLPRRHKRLATLVSANAEESSSNEDECSPLIPTTMGTAWHPRETKTQGSILG